MNSFQRGNAQVNEIALITVSSPRGEKGKEFYEVISEARDFLKAS
ncbi:hypothetical protein ACFOU2_23235 [Bacillus songklensis]|uniref:Uncharacterized protein n=1 Tax=Bacillus songklensis TaxID=1069116 RepID=A0ABV8BAS9_9BACI